MITCSQMGPFNSLSERDGQGLWRLGVSRLGGGRNFVAREWMIEKSVSKGTVQAPFWSLSMDDA